MTPSLNGASGPVFPTEVFEHIIDIIAEGDGYFYNGEKVPSLHACALVARSWVPRSRIHLYRDIELDSDLRTTQFLDSVTKSPALGKYVRFLMIWPLSDKRESSGGWIFRAINILPPLLPHLYELILWSLPDLHPVYIAVLSRFRTIESLELRFIDWNSLQEIVQLINRFPRLRRLRVRDCGWKVPGRCYHGKQHNLSSLEMQRNHLSVKPLLEWVFESDSTRALTAFCTESHVSASALDRILQSCCSTLRELSLVFYGDEVEIPPLTKHRALQRLAFCGSLKHVLSVLARLPLFAPSSIVSIFFHISNDTDEPSFIKASESELKAVDLALCDSKFLHLTCVGLFQTLVVGEEVLSQPIEDVHTFFQRALPKSYMRGILWYRSDYQNPQIRIAPAGAPHYPGLPVEWEFHP